MNRLRTIGEFVLILALTLAVCCGPSCVADYFRGTAVPPHSEGSHHD